MPLAPANLADCPEANQGDHPMNIPTVKANPAPLTVGHGGGGGMADIQKAGEEDRTPDIQLAKVAEALARGETGAEMQPLVDAFRHHRANARRARDRFEEATFDRREGIDAAERYLNSHEIPDTEPPTPWPFIVAVLVILAGLVFVCAFSWQSIAAALGFAGLSSMAGAQFFAEAGRDAGVVR